MCSVYTRFVAWDYCAAPGLAFTGGAHGQGDNDVEKQCLDEAKAPCLNWRRQTRTGARYTQRSLAKPKRADLPETRAPLTGL
jgi:hypothetical protein